MMLNRLIDRVQYNGSIGRLHIYAISLYVACIADAPSSNLSKIFDESGVFGDFVGLVFATCAIMGVIDTVVNDFMNEKWTFFGALKYRHYLLMTIACNYAVSIAIAHENARGFWFQVFFSINLCTTVLAAYFDVRRRFK